jgi:hypothetical protein
MYRLTKKFSAPPFSDIAVENFVENTQMFYDIGAGIGTK